MFPQNQNLKEPLSISINGKEIVFHDAPFMFQDQEELFNSVINSLKEATGIKTDKHVALLLSMSDKLYTHYKSRHELPFNDIIMTCEQCHIPLDKIFPIHKSFTIKKPVANYETAAQQTQANNLETSNSAPLRNAGDDLKSPNALTSKYQRALEICKLCQAVGEVSTFNYAAGMRFDSMLRQLYPHTPIEQLTLGQISAVSQRLADEF